MTMRFVQLHFKELIETEGFAKLDLSSVLRLLDHDELFVMELSIFEAAQRYVKENNITDKDKIQKVVNCVRLAFIPPPDMFTVIKNTNYFTEEQMYTALEFQLCPEKSTAKFKSRKFGSLTKEETLLFGKGAGKIIKVSEQEESRKAENLASGNDDGWVTFTNGKAFVEFELECMSRLTRFKMTNYASKRYSIVYKSYEDDEEWKVYKDWTSIESSEEVELTISMEDEPVVAQYVKLMVDDGNYTSFKLFNVYGYKLMK